MWKWWIKAGPKWKGREIQLKWWILIKGFDTLGFAGSEGEEKMNKWEVIRIQMAAKPEGMTTAAWKNLNASIRTHEEKGEISEKD